MYLWITFEGQGRGRKLDCRRLMKYNEFIGRKGVFNLFKPTSLKQEAEK